MNKLKKFIVVKLMGLGLIFAFFGLMFIVQGLSMILSVFQATLLLFLISYIGFNILYVNFSEEENMIMILLQELAMILLALLITGGCLNFLWDPNVLNCDWSEIISACINK